MSTLANITSLNLSLQTGGAALAVKAVKSVAKPERVVYVFGTADDVAPNFTTVAGALTYANSLTPLAEEPVVIRLFTKTDGAPYTFADIAEPLDWDEYANGGLFFVSDYVRLNKTTSIPSSLPVGQQVWYIDPNGVETLWVGREDGSAWPAVGYKEYSFAIFANVGGVLSFDTKLDTVGGITIAQGGTGDESKIIFSGLPSQSLSLVNPTVILDGSDVITYFTYGPINQNDSNLVMTDSNLDSYIVNPSVPLLVTFRVYP